VVTPVCMKTKVKQLVTIGVMLLLCLGLQGCVSAQARQPVLTNGVAYSSQGLEKIGNSILILILLTVILLTIKTESENT
jgi:hypothetical protein